MKKNQPFLYSIIIIGLGVMLMSACKKGDTSSPVVTLNGDSVVYVTLNQNYDKTVDAGATSNDDVDINNNYVYNDLGTNNPNVNKTGTYIIKYWATDGAGNTGTTSRTVIVWNNAEFLAGTYNVADTAGGIEYVYAQIITPDQAVNNRIRFSKFGNYLNADIFARATIDKDSIYIPFQTANFIGTIVETHQFTGTGVINGQDLIIKYTDNNVTKNISTTCVAHYTRQ